MKSLFTEKNYTGKIFICDDNTNPVKYLDNFTEYKECEIPKIFKELLHNTSLVISVPLDDNFRLDLNVDSYKIIDINEFNFTCYIYGDNDTIEYIKNNLIKNKNLRNWCVKRLIPEYDISWILKHKKEKNFLKKMLDISDADALYVSLKMEEYDIDIIMEIFTGNIYLINGSGKYDKINK